MFRTHSQHHKTMEDGQLDGTDTHMLDCAVFVQHVDELPLPLPPFAGMSSSFFSSGYCPADVPS